MDKFWENNFVTTARRFLVRMTHIKLGVRIIKISVLVETKTLNLEWDWCGSLGHFLTSYSIDTLDYHYHWPNFTTFRDLCLDKAVLPTKHAYWKVAFVRAYISGRLLTSWINSSYWTVINLSFTSITFRPQLSALSLRLAPKLTSTLRRAYFYWYIPIRLVLRRLPFSHEKPLNRFLSNYFLHTNCVLINFMGWIVITWICCNY